jgi:protein-tyrosine phosphatase
MEAAKKGTRYTKRIRRLARNSMNLTFDFIERLLDRSCPPPIRSDSKTAKIKVLFVCWGNVCRSPMAEGIFRQMVAERGLLGEIFVDSAGTGGHNIGKRYDWRARACLRKRQINISNRRARQVNNIDFKFFDYIIVMDHKNLNAVLELAQDPSEMKKVSLLLSHMHENKPSDIPDPFGESLKGFERICLLIEKGCRALLENIVPAPSIV